LLQLADQSSQRIKGSTMQATGEVLRWLSFGEAAFDDDLALGLLR
jgi:hypothetical protein